VATAAAVAAAAVAATSATDMRGASPMTTASAAMAPAAAVTNKLHHRRCAVAFFVEYVEGSQADIRDFFLTKSDLIAISVAWSG
jgi:hypothetical protein